MIEPDAYQNFKPFILALLSLSRDAVHIHVGFIVYLMTAVIRRSPFVDWKNLIPCILLSLCMELMDVWADMTHSRRILYSAYAHDLINTNLIPIVLYFFSRLGLLRTSAK